MTDHPRVATTDGLVRRDFAWPGGARCALSVSWDVDFDSVLHLQHGDRAFDQYSALSFFRYDEVAVPNIVAACAELDIRSTFFVPGWCIEHYPDVCRAIADGGHEVAHHGYLHEGPNSQLPEAELAWLRRGADAIESLAGKRPVGWRAPHAAPSAVSMDYLVREGFTYDSSLANDHDPFLLDVESGTLIELPCEVTMSDWPHYAHVPDLGYLMPPKLPSDAVAVYASELDAALEGGGFLTTIWHPHVSGRPARLRAWVRWVRELKARGDVWITTLEEIAAHLRGFVDSGGQLRHVRFPFYSAPVEEVKEFATTYRKLDAPGWPK
ncbi:MAG TPA: polysaccharide deacetylase family protein [Acidimicrobiales bacterium]|nr:polysaccharide deacetylase family protein [Acidimicrobiales bacterium]